MEDGRFVAFERPEFVVVDGVAFHAAVCSVADGVGDVLGRDVAESVADLGCEVDDAFAVAQTEHLAFDVVAAFGQNASCLNEQWIGRRNLQRYMVSGDFWR